MRGVIGAQATARLYCREVDGVRPTARGRAVGAEDQVNHAELADEALAGLLARRDVGALETLYARHARAVYSLALKMLAEPPAAEEVVQECFLKLWRQPELYQAQRGRLLPWLLGVAHHRAIDRLRRRRLEQRHTVHGEIDVPANGQGDPERHAWGRLCSEAVRRALATLPPTQRQVLELGYLKGMTQSEIAAALNEPLGTVKTRMRLAMQKLRTAPELASLVVEAG